MEDGVAEAAEVEVVVLDARPHPEPGLEAARPGLQQSRLGGGEMLEREGKGGTSVKETKPKAALYIYKKPKPGGKGRG